MKYALAISGGAARGAFALGCLHYFDESGIEIELFSGTSIGAVIASSYACGVKPKELLEIFCSKEFRKVIQFNCLNGSLFKIDQNAGLLKKIIPIEKLEDFPKKVIVSAVDIKSGRLISFTQGDAITIVVASCALYPMFKPISYQDYFLVDGGVKENLPLSVLTNSALPIIAINHFPYTPFNPSSLKENLKRMLYLSWYNTFEASIKHVQFNITSEQLTPLSLFGFKDLRKAFLLGYEETSKVFSKTL
ncbi:MAG: patatin-like phospholipase family protein [Candidatus Marinarcus sp.]|uniref:patatin-like phospholipase family protein n=1 Tax=Candidatus Marinarcus sp. TaxID=3100987 RepID=UPI003B00D23D